FPWRRPPGEAGGGRLRGASGGTGGRLAALAGPGDRPGDEHGDEVALVVGGRVEGSGGVDQGRRQSAGLFGRGARDESLGCVREEERAVGDGADGDPGPSDAAVPVEEERDGHGGQREVAVPLRHLQEGAAGPDGADGRAAALVPIWTVGGAALVPI